MESNDDRIVEGWGSVQIIDNQGDYVPIDSIIKLMPTYMKRGGILIDGHTNRHVGKIIHWEPKDKDGKPSLYLKAQIFKDYSIDDMVWDAIKKTHYTGFSFGGRSLKKHPVCKDNQCFNHIDEPEIWEWSIVPKPANKESIITEFNDVAKMDSSLFIPTEKDGKLTYVPIGENMSIPGELQKEEIKENNNMAPDIPPEEQEKSDPSMPVNPPAEESGGPMNEVLELLRSMDERLSRLEGSGPDEEKAALDEPPEQPPAPEEPEEEEKAETPKTVTVPEAPASQEAKTMNKSDSEIVAALIGELKKSGFVQTPRPGVNPGREETPRPVSMGEYLMKGSGATPSINTFDVHSALAGKEWQEIENIATGRVN